jgi:alpha-D-xyloside xylohydrolase
MTVRPPYSTILRSLALAAASLALLAAGGCREPRAPKPEQAAREAAEAAGSYARTADGVVIVPASGPAKRVRLQVMNDAIVRVTATPLESLDLPESLMVVAKPAATFDVWEAGGVVTVATGAASAEASLATGVVRFRNAGGEVVLAEADRGTFDPVTLDGEGFHAVRQEFNRGTDEAFYGLGQHQDGRLNSNGADVLLAQHNIEIAMPFVVSSRNYGVLWDNYSITRFGDPRPYGKIGETLIVRDADGNEGGLTARYFVDGALRATRVEEQPDYAFTFSMGEWPEGIAQSTPNLRVVWDGSLESDAGGVHRFKLWLSGYGKVYIDGEKIIDGWRQSWLPWWRNFEVAMTAGEPRSIRIEWDTDGGHIGLAHLDPLPADQRTSLSLASEVGHAIDYYFISGENLDDVIAGYRHLTGAAKMLPRWAYGFWQSRERYQTQEQLLDTVREYRRRRIPLDSIVLDWFYWPEDSWGSHDFDRARFPDPRAMVDEVHDLNARIMISVWPKFYPATEHFEELDALGAIFRRSLETGEVDWVGRGYESGFYDPYDAEARKVYWRQIRDKLDVLGFDAWWLDATEPDMGHVVSLEEFKRRLEPTALGPGAEYANPFALMNARAVFEGERSVDPSDRVMILTRSGFPGIQRYGAATWSGDVVPTWYDMENQIAAGLNMALSGVPNWTFDIGGFTPERRYLDPSPEDLAEWRELQTRWFQFGAFAPLFRSHGQFPPREIYNIATKGSEPYETMVWYDRLRYRLLPYIYSEAGRMHHAHGTLMRALVMDFPDDPKVLDIGDQYMFGPAFLVSPVYEYGARTREVYLPAGADWCDFYTGEQHAGGATITADAPLSRMPLFVKAGSIVPTGPAVQYADQDLGGPITLLVYAGADGSFELYEDDGETYAYEDGAFSSIPIRYDDATGAVTIGERVGTWDGMPQTRTFNVRWISGTTDAATEFDAGDATVEYSGAAVTVDRP